MGISHNSKQGGKVPFGKSSSLRRSAQFEGAYRRGSYIRDDLDLGVIVRQARHLPRILSNSSTLPCSPSSTITMNFSSTSFLFLILTVSFSLPRTATGLGKVSSVSGYVVLLHPSGNVSASVESVARRTGDAREALFSARVDKRTVLDGRAGVAGFRMVCDEETASAVAADENVRLVERDSPISVDGY